MLGEILTAIVTPFKADGSVDSERFQALASHLVGALDLLLLPVELGVKSLDHRVVDG